MCIGPDARHPDNAAEVDKSLVARREYEMRLRQQVCFAGRRTSRPSETASFGTPGAVGFGAETAGEAAFGLHVVMSDAMLLRGRSAFAGAEVRLRRVTLISVRVCCPPRH